MKQLLPLKAHGCEKEIVLSQARCIQKRYGKKNLFMETWHNSIWKKLFYSYVITQSSKMFKAKTDSEEDI